MHDVILPRLDSMQEAAEDAAQQLKERAHCAGSVSGAVSACSIMPSFTAGALHRSISTLYCPVTSPSARARLIHDSKMYRRAPVQINPAITLALAGRRAAGFSRRPGSGGNGVITARIFYWGIRADQFSPLISSPPPSSKFADRPAVFCQRCPLDLEPCALPVGCTVPSSAGHEWDDWRGLGALGRADAPEAREQVWRDQEFISHDNMPSSVGLPSDAVARFLRDRIDRDASSSVAAGDHQPRR